MRFFPMANVYKLPKSFGYALVLCTVMLCCCNRQQSQNDRGNSSETAIADLQNAGQDESNQRVVQAGFESTDSKNNVRSELDDSVGEYLKDKMEPAKALALANQIDTLSKHAKLLETNGQFGAAVTAWRRVRQALLASFSEDSWQVANADVSIDFARHINNFTPQQFRAFEQLVQLQSQLETQVSQNQIQQAISTATECQRVVSELLGPESIWNAKVHYQLGELYYRLNKLDEAIERLQTAVRLFEKRYPKEHPDIENSLDKISLALRASNRLNDAISIQQNLTMMTEHIWGTHSVEHAKRLNDLGTLQHSLKMLDEAEQTLAKADSIRETMLGPNHLERALTLRNRAVVALDKKQLSTARDMFAHAKDIFSHELGMTHDWSIDATKKLAVVYLMQKENEKAEIELTIVKNAVLQTLGDQNLKYADACFELAIAMGNQGKFEQAKPLLDHAEKLQRTYLGPQNSTTLRTKSVLATIDQRLAGRQNNR